MTKLFDKGYNYFILPLCLDSLFYFQNFSLTSFDRMQRVKGYKGRFPERVTIFLSILSNLCNEKFNGY